jgi:predicted nucleic acid-binding protein
MRLLLDTNIFLEVILEQERHEEARTLPSKFEEHEFFLSDYSFHSIFSFAWGNTRSFGNS